jgi:hypothetical protein
MARIVEVIYAEQIRGRGTEKNPTRRVQQLWTKEGELLDELDPVMLEQDEYSRGWLRLSKEGRS